MAKTENGELEYDINHNTSTEKLEKVIAHDSNCSTPMRVKALSILYHRLKNNTCDQYL